MSANILVDTNILVYAYDRSEVEKQKRALNILEQLAISGVGVLSAQVLAEFFVAVTRKIAGPIPVERAVESIENYMASWAVFDITPLVVLEAARGVREHQFSYYDAQLWACARLNQIPVVFSEDFNPSRIEGVQFVNPLAPESDWEQWV